MGTSGFAAKRAQHYNEMAAVKALRARKFDESSTESERSDDDSDHGVKAKKNAEKSVVSVTAAPAPAAENAAVEGNEVAVRSAAEEASWKAKRNAHYNEMAAALRAAPPPSDDEDDDDDD